MCLPVKTGYFSKPLKKVDHIPSHSVKRKIAFVTVLRPGLTGKRDFAPDDYLPIFFWRLGEQERILPHIGRIASMRKLLFNLL